MPSIIPGYEYDIFISYRQNDNQDGWVTEFIQSLNREIKSAFKENISVYFDDNPHDGLLETHDVDDSLAKKLKCLIFIPIISKTYCDPNTFAWTNEFLAFNELANNDEYGLKVTLPIGNTASRVLPIRIHDIDDTDKQLVENEIGFLRSIDFVYQSAGVNRPLRPKDDDVVRDTSQTFYRDQINKVANAIQDIIAGLREAESPTVEAVASDETQTPTIKKTQLTSELKRRNVLRASLVYILTALVFWKVADISIGLLNLPGNTLQFIALSLIVFFPIAMLMAWLYERSPQGFIKTGSTASRENPFTDAQKKPLTSNTFILLLVATVAALFIIFPSGVSRPESIAASEASIGIIPFRNNTGDAELNHYGVGLASEVRTELSLSKQFDFISSLQATIRYQNSDDDPQQIGIDLGVTHIVSGMYQTAGNNMQVIVEMVETATGKVVWNLPYKTQYKDLFSLQADIAEKVMEKFAVNKVQREVPTLNMEAYTYFAQGNEITISTNLFRDRIKALPYYEKAIELDSGYLAAWTGLIGNMSYYYFNARDTVYTPGKIRPYYEYVEANFPESWQKNEIRGIYAYWVNGDYQSGLRYFQETLNENPQAQWAIGIIGAIYRRTMQHEKALRNRTLIVKISPHSVPNWNELAIVFRGNGDYENAEIAWMKVFELNNQNTGYLYGLKRGTNTLEELPEIVKAQRGNTYKADFLREKRNYVELSTFLDTVKLDSTFNILSHNYYKTVNHYNLIHDDSSRYYANKYLNILENEFELDIPFGSFPSKYQMLSIIGLKDEATKLWDPFIDLLDEDLISQWGLKSFEFTYMAINGNYEAAGELLQAMNREYPQMGDYAWLNLPIYDRIKEEYPPFIDIINNLRLPPKLTEQNPLKM